MVVAVVKHVLSVVQHACVRLDEAFEILELLLGTVVFLFLFLQQPLQLDSTLLRVQQGGRATSTSDAYDAVPGCHGHHGGRFLYRRWQHTQDKALCNYNRHEDSRWRQG